MQFIALFEDDPTAPADLRQKHMPAHLAFLEKHAAEVQAAGPLVAEDGRPGGGIWVLDVAGFEAVDQLVTEDPFWPTGLRKTVTVLRWNQVFAQGKRLIGR